MSILLEFSLVKTVNRLTFDIHWQHGAVTWKGVDDDPDHPAFVASNGIRVISRSRLDLQAGSIWLMGSADWNVGLHRSSSMTFPDNESRDAAYDSFLTALQEWGAFAGGDVLLREYRYELRALR